MTRLIKILETKPDSWGSTKSINVKVDFDPNENSISNLMVTFSDRLRNTSDITDLFETVPEFVNLVDNIDWNEIYSNEMAARAEKESEYA